MPLESIARLILEWWRTGERTAARLETLTVHFGEQYGLDAGQREHVEAILRSWQVSREGW